MSLFSANFGSTKYFGANHAVTFNQNKKIATVYKALSKYMHGTVIKPVTTTTKYWYSIIYLHHTTIICDNFNAILIHIVYLEFL